MNQRGNVVWFGVGAVLIVAALFFSTLLSTVSVEAFTVQEVEIREKSFFDSLFGSALSVISQPETLKLGEFGSVTLFTHIPEQEKAAGNFWRVTLQSNTVKKGTISLPCVDCDAKITIKFVAPTREELELLQSQGRISSGIDLSSGNILAGFEFVTTDAQGRNTGAEYAFIPLVFGSISGAVCGLGESYCQTPELIYGCATDQREFISQQTCQEGLRCVQLEDTAQCETDPFFVPPEPEPEPTPDPGPECPQITGFKVEATECVFTTDGCEVDFSSKQECLDSIAVQPDGPIGDPGTEPNSASGPNRGVFGALWGWIAGLFKDISIV